MSYTVSLEVDRRYRWDDRSRRYVETCPGCGADRPGTGALCPCGREFSTSPEKLPFATLSWKPPTLTPTFPDRCPHCLGKPTKTVSYWAARHTGENRDMFGARQLEVEVPVCGKVVSPLLLGTAQLLAWCAVIVAGLGVLFSILAGPPIGLLLFFLVSCAALVWTIRANRWVRFARFDHRSYRIRAARKAWARELAELNGGRLVRR